MVASAELLPSLKERAGAIDGELVTFSDAEALTALQAIMKRKPNLVALERSFAVTPRGAAQPHQGRPVAQAGGDPHPPTTATTCASSPARRRRRRRSTSAARGARR